MPKNAENPNTVITTGHATLSVVVYTSGAPPPVRKTATSARPHEANGSAWLVVTNVRADPKWVRVSAAEWARATSVQLVRVTAAASSVASDAALFRSFANPSKISCFNVNVFAAIKVVS